jgi:hemoglobin-like flavoprotein
VTGPDTLARFHASLERARADAGFLDRFYDAFIAASPEIEAIFEGKDMGRLKRKLASSLHVMTLAVDDAPGTDDYLRFLGRMHARFRLRPEHFDLWVDSLVGTAAHCDPEFNAGDEAAWRTVLAAGLALMRQGMDRTKPRHDARRDRQG